MNRQNLAAITRTDTPWAVCQLYGQRDPAQCEAIGDQQLTDMKPHPRTGDTHAGTHVELSNAGLAFYNSIERVIVLTKIHRVSCIENPTTEDEIRHNDRANEFMQVLRKVRDLELTEEDYFWLTELKESKASMEKKILFADAPF